MSSQTEYFIAELVTICKRGVKTDTDDHFENMFIVLTYLNYLNNLTGYKRMVINKDTKHNLSQLP